MSSALTIYHDQTVVGVLSVNVQGQMSFRYNSHWMRSASGFPVSLSLPFQEEDFEEKKARPFFANLLPEGNVRELIARRFKISTANDFRLLEAIGGDCAGALSLLSTSEAESKKEKNEEYRPLSLEQLDESITGIPNIPLLSEEKDLRLSLAGVQQKLPVYREKNALFLPYGRAASTHILKPAIPSIEDSIMNEMFCMRLAKKVGLPVPFVDIVKTPSHQIFCVERYDRNVLGEKKVVRLHQEDFCQALSLNPGLKYQNEGGPSIENLFSIIEAHSSKPAMDKKNLLQWIIFNFLIGNYDAHGKNISLLISSKQIVLAPFYDLMSTAVYDKLTVKMAMKIGGEYDADKVFDRHWERLAETFRVKKTFVLKFVADMKKKTKKEAELLAEDYKSSAVVKKIVAHILKKTGDL